MTCKSCCFSVGMLMFDEKSWEILTDHHDLINDILNHMFIVADIFINSNLVRKSLS